MKMLSIAQGQNCSTHGQVTPKRIVQSGANLNLSQILYLSWLPVSLRKIQSEQKGQSIGQGQKWPFLALKGK